jgi:hypothetical protein
MTFRLEDTNGHDLGFGLLDESSAFDFARRFTTASGNPVWVQRFLHNDEGELVPVGESVQIGADAEATP